MSALRYCPAGAHDVGGYFDGPADPLAWACPTCHAARIERGRAAVAAYTSATRYTDGDDDGEHEYAAQDLISDILHYLDQQYGSSVALEAGGRGIQRWEEESNALAFD